MTGTQKDCGLLRLRSSFKMSVWIYTPMSYWSPCDTNQRLFVGRGRMNFSTFNLPKSLIKSKGILVDVCMCGVKTEGGKCMDQ